jgi:DNA-binding NarL/FixJ family response regulator
VALAESLRPEVILMDLLMPDVDCVTATERILAASPSIRIVVVTTYESDADILREVEVLGLVAKGKTNAEIGRVLHISEATVKTHLLRAFNKLDVSDRTAAVTTAMALGLLD